VLFKGKTSLRQLYVKPLRLDPSARNRLPKLSWHLRPLLALSHQTRRVF
jgi:hypothetical protein